MKKFVIGVFYSVLPVSFAGEINFAGLFDGGSGDKISEQTKLEQKLESNLANFRSVASAKVAIPVNGSSRMESLWSQGEARVMPVEVILKLKKARRLSLGEYRSIYNLISSSLADKLQVVQPVIRDEDGFEWTEDGADSKARFKATALENEIVDRLKTQWNKDVTWTQVHVSVRDGACKINGTYGVKEHNLNLQLRRDVMSLLQDLCPSARLSMVPSEKMVQAANSTPFVLWLERLAYVMLGFALWGLVYGVRHWRKKSLPVETSDDGAIILTKIVEKCPDQAAKWMVQALKSESKLPADKLPEPKPADNH